RKLPLSDKEFKEYLKKAQQKDHEGESEVSSLWDTRFSTSTVVKDHLYFPKDLEKVKKD
ncbi:hypothetical protein A2U01_0072312, partial [Trifolium medium]|nr:hypothetical protein [Trifolium medium]